MVLHQIIKVDEFGSESFFGEVYEDYALELAQTRAAICNRTFEQCSEDAMPHYYVQTYTTF